jgi:SAM-dependent methyltransferase
MGVQGWRERGGEPPGARPSASSAAVFERLAARYDEWYEGPVGRVAFPMEVECLAPMLEGTGRPRLEIGVGSGRFAAALDVEFGIDPAHAPLRLARSRGVTVVRGLGEALPFGDGSFGAVLIVVTLCFADDPLALLREAHRVLRDPGALVLGMVFADSPWGAFYRERALAGHPFYAAARFLRRTTVRELLARTGFQLTASRSVLRQPPGSRLRLEAAVEGDHPEAGFVAWKAAP